MAAKYHPEISSCSSDRPSSGTAPLEGDSEVRLTIDNFTEVFSSLLDVRHKWFYLGLQLDVNVKKLEDIERECSGDDKKGLRKMLTTVMENQSQVTLTWKKICDALRSPSLEEGTLAAKLEQNLKTAPKATVTFLYDKDPRRPRVTACTSFASASDDLSLLILNSQSCTQSEVDPGHGLTAPEIPSATAVVAIRRHDNSPKIKRLPRHCNDKNCDSCFKVNIIGDSGVGKTTMLLRFLKPENKFGDHMVGCTICHEAIGTCEFEYNEKIVKLIVWDTAGFERNFDMIPINFFRDVDGTIIMFDVTNKQSLVNALSDSKCSKVKKKCWLKEVDYKAEDDHKPVKLLVGGKIDVNPRKREVTQAEAEEYAHNRRVPYLEVSSKENIGVQEVFYKLVDLLMKRESQDDFNIRRRQRDTVVLQDTRSRSTTASNEKQTVQTRCNKC